ncbi:hypothetical protein B0H14DRAFT_2612323 [Mycena olivaceomarginata]|nr:hypothetical protein B0H14DRAFT_2612323 [Mycena olivaceomarginata]
MSVFVQAPRLRCVTLHSWRDSIGLGLLGIPWHGLTEFEHHINGFSPISHYYFRSSECRSLITALISVDSDDNGILECAEVGYCPVPARRLTVNADCLGSAARFLQNISLDFRRTAHLGSEGELLRTDFPRPFIAGPSAVRFGVDPDCALLDSNLVMWLGACSLGFRPVYRLCLGKLDSGPNRRRNPASESSSPHRFEGGPRCSAHHTPESPEQYYLLDHPPRLGRSRSRKEIEKMAQADFEGGRGFFGSPLSQHFI